MTGKKTQRSVSCLALHCRIWVQITIIHNEVVQFKVFETLRALGSKARVLPSLSQQFHTRRLPWGQPAGKLADSIVKRGGGLITPDGQDIFQGN